MQDKNMVTRSSSLSQWALFLSTIVIFSHCVGATGEESCACASNRFGIPIDCDNTDMMLAALPILQSNACQSACSSALCRRNYFIVQAHHDYCPESAIPGLVEDGLHTYEDACEDCNIVRLTDFSLPSCPQVDCSDNSGNQAYMSLIEGDCLNVCGTSTSCGSNFQVLRAVHDLCPEDSLDQVAELGIHDFEEPCESQACNVDDTNFGQLLCPQDSSTISSAAVKPAGSPWVLAGLTIAIVATPTAFQGFLG